MENKVEFKCEGENLEQIPDIIIEKTGITFPEAHKDKNQMAILAKEIREYKKDTVVRIPFCVTVEAEALGGDIKLGDAKTGPRVRDYRFENVEAMQQMSEMNLESGRIKEVLDCVELLSNQGEVVSLNVEGPFTIISSLIDPINFYKGMRKNKEAVLNIIQVTEDSIVNYIIEGLKRGAKIISYGDPVGAMDIVGPKVYEEFSGKTTYNILKRVEKHLNGAVIHICGKSSVALVKLGFAETIPVEFPEDIKYGEAINFAIKVRKDIKFIGHRCIKKSCFMLGNKILWSIKLK
jgi:MtaA/CmuA family methyltransferase